MQSRGRTRRPILQEEPRRRTRRLVTWLVLIAVAVLGITVFRLWRGARTQQEISQNRLPCLADQDVTLFGDNVLYYDGASIHCLAGGGGIRWSFPVGSGAQFSASDEQLVIWVGSQLFIVDRNGKPSYNENMNGPVQFARVGSRYAAVVIGEDTEPELNVINLDGTRVDTEIEAYSGMMLLDVGFYGADDQYMWTLAMDVYGTAINTVLNTFQVGKMNTGVVNLGSFLAYKVLFENSSLHVFTTQQMYTYDYKAVQDMSGTRLVYGWQLIDSTVPDRGPGSMLLATTSQLTGSSITDLRVLTGSVDRRYTLPSSCVGAAIQGKNIYAVSADYLYRADIDNQRFYGYALPLPDGCRATGFVGLTKSGRAIITSGDDVFTVSLPK